MKIVPFTQYGHPKRSHTASSVDNGVST
jgi:hypothetical protein